jgi:hypothetical protein
LPNTAAAKEPPRAEASTAYHGSIVGLWKRHTACQQAVHALEQAGLGELAADAAVGNGFIPGVFEVAQLEDPQHPCKHAVPLWHYHFFTPDGFFGSLDQNLEQADDGAYTVQGAPWSSATRPSGRMDGRGQLQRQTLASRELGQTLTSGPCAR